MAGSVNIFDPPFDIAMPQELALPFVFNSPHSGRLYPTDLLDASRLDARTLRRSEDAYVDELLHDVVGLGAPLMSARFPRAYLDLNREPYELDPSMFEGRLPPFTNSRSMRVAGGLGTIPRIVGDAQEIYAKRLPASEATRRIETLYKPYHAALRHLLSLTHGAFGYTVLFDFHSMPSSSFTREDQPRIDVVLGDRYGTSCSRLLTDMVDTELRQKGYGVIRNKPYAGGFITEHYGQPVLGRHALQIEVNRALYMDERSLEKHDGFGRLRADLADLVATLATAPLYLMAGDRLAAE